MRHEPLNEGLETSVDIQTQHEVELFHQIKTPFNISPFSFLNFYQKHNDIIKLQNVNLERGNSIAPCVEPIASQSSSRNRPVVALRQ